MALISYISFFSYIKIFKVSSATYHQKNKEMLHKKLMKSNKKKKKQKNREYGCKKYKLLSKHEKQRLVE